MKTANWQLMDWRSCCRHFELVMVYALRHVIDILGALLFTIYRFIYGVHLECASPADSILFIIIIFL